MNRDRLVDLFFSRSVAIQSQNGKSTAGIYSSDFDNLIDLIWKEIQEDYPQNGFVGTSVICDLCSYTWVAVFEKVTEKLECPNCHNMTNIELYNPAND